MVKDCGASEAEDFRNLAHGQSLFAESGDFLFVLGWFLGVARAKTEGAGFHNDFDPAHTLASTNWGKSLLRPVVAYGFVSAVPEVNEFPVVYDSHVACQTDYR